MNDPEEEECDHEWEFVDASFDHEFGTETIHYWRCELCDETTNEDPHPEPLIDPYDEWKERDL